MADAGRSTRLPWTTTLPLLSRRRLAWGSLERDLDAATHDDCVTERYDLHLPELDAEIAPMIPRVPNEREEALFRICVAARVCISQIVGQQGVQRAEILTDHCGNARCFQCEDLFHRGYVPQNVR